MTTGLSHNDFDIGHEAYLAKGRKLDRSTGSTESVKEFMDKPKSKEIASLLKKGKSTRDIAGRLGVSLNLVV